MTPTALIAEDEPLLAQALRSGLKLAWPELDIVAMVGDGNSALQQALRHQPDVLFFDVRMPGMDGLDAAAALLDAWPLAGPDCRPFPALVFVTAYDQYALRAFERRAVDYLVKPVQPQRLAETVARLQSSLESRIPATESFDATLAQLRDLIDGAAGAPATRIKVIAAGVGSVVRMVPVDSVVYFEAADKYVRVLTAGHEYLIRTPLKELLPQLDPASFWQVHRGTVVRCDVIEGVSRDEAGKLWLQLRGRSERLAVSRLYAHLFKAM